MKLFYLEALSSALRVVHLQFYLCTLQCLCPTPKVCYWYPILAFLATNTDGAQLSVFSVVLNRDCLDLQASKSQYIPLHSNRRAFVLFNCQLPRYPAVSVDTEIRIAWPRCVISRGASSRAGLSSQAGLARTDGSGHDFVWLTHPTFQAPSSS